MGWRSAAMVTGAGLGLGAYTTGGGWVAQWWLGTTAGLLCAWLLLGILWQARDPVTVLRRAAVCLAPLSALLLRGLGTRLDLPATLVMAAEATAMGAAVALSAAWLMPSPAPPRLTAIRRWIGSRAALWLLVGLWFVYAAAIAVVGWHGLRSPSQDLAIYEQAAYNTLDGRFLAYSTDIRFCGVVMSRFADHFEPIILLFVPLYAIWASPIWFLLAQPLALASGALPVAYMAHRGLQRPEAGTLFAALYLLHPSLYVTLAPDFHPEVLAAPLILWGLWAALEGRLTVASVALVAALACKESIPATVFMVGAWLALRGHRRYGAAVCALAAVWAAVAFLWVIPSASPTGASFYSGILDDPRREAAAAGGQALRIYLLARADYVLSTIAPLVGMPVLAPSALAIAAPELALHVLSTNPWMGRITAWYHVTLLAGLLPAAILGTGWLARQARRRGLSLGAVLIGLGVSAVLYLSGTPSLLRYPLEPWPHPVAGAAQVRALLGRVPDDAPTLVNSPELACHLARREMLVFAWTPGWLPAESFTRARTMAYLAAQASLTPVEAARLEHRHGLELLGREGNYRLWRVLPDARAPDPPAE